jgi:hypothetical protein
VLLHVLMVVRADVPRGQGQGAPRRARATERKIARVGRDQAEFRQLPHGDAIDCYDLSRYARTT